jgi:hypothetical protein
MITVLLWIAVLVVAVHTGIKIGMEYVDFERMKDEMEIKASVAQVLKDEEILAALVAKARELGLPLDAEDFILQRDETNRTMMISTQWDREVHFLFDVYKRTYHFAPSVGANYGSATKPVL